MVYIKLLLCSPSVDSITHLLQGQETVFSNSSRTVPSFAYFNIMFVNLDIIAKAQDVEQANAKKTASVLPFFVTFPGSMILNLSSCPRWSNGQATNAI